MVQSGAGHIDAAIAGRDDACELGRWLNSYRPTLQEAAIFDVVRTKHAAFHRSVGKIVTLADTNRRTQALAGLAKGSEFARLSDELLTGLSNWKALFA